MSLKNCWEIKNCGRELGGLNAHELGVCPAYPDRGHSCWMVAGTLCGGEVQGTFAKKAATCQQCEAYQRYSFHSDAEKDELFREFSPEMLLYLKDANKRGAERIPDHLLASLIDAVEQNIHDRALQLIEANAELKRAQDLLSAENKKLNAALSNISHGLAMFDSSEHLIVCNERYLKIYGYSPDLVKPGCSFREIIAERIKSDNFFTDDVDDFIGDLRKKLGNGITVKKFATLRDGRVISVVDHPAPDGGWVTIHEDVTELKKAEEKIAYAALHDDLTGLNNRPAFNNRLSNVLSRLARYQEPCVVMLLDLDGFKQVNDTLGHAAGDSLLKVIADRLKSSIREVDVLARLGGDEFVIVQIGAENPREAAITLAIKLLEVVCKPVNLDGHEVAIGTSIGIVVAPQDGVEPGELLKKADLALYRVKSSRRNDFAFFDEKMSQAATARLQLINEMRKALSRDEFELHYQPIFNAQTRQPWGAEALVRWHHPVEGLIPPDRFIPLAEESGIMELLGEWILENACAEAAKWPSAMKVAVNLSAIQFRSSRLFDVILCALVDSGLSPDRVELEITESITMDDGGDYNVTIQQLKNLGICIALDDFGIGFSSMRYLTKVPFDRIKIDRSFVRGLTTSAGCAAIVASVLTLARGLDIFVTAEGVETDHQFELLRVAGVQQVQGYLFGRPCSPANLDFSSFLTKEYVIGAA